MKTNSVLAGFILVTWSMASQAAVFTVTSTADTTAAGTLRWAMTSANANSGTTDNIVFNIPGTPPHVIVITTNLPELVYPNTHIYADTQPGYSLTNPAIHIKPSAEYAGVNSFLFSSSTSNCVFRGMLISGFTNGTAINLAGHGVNLVAANIIISNRTGVYIGSGKNNTVGGTNVADRNVISHSIELGVRVSPSPGSTNNFILGNFIGTDLEGKTAWPNGLGGVYIDNSPQNVVSGTNNAPQIISGNGSAGVYVLGPNAGGNFIDRNFIGVDITGTQKLANTTSGVVLHNVNTMYVRDNIISGNGEVGVHLRDGSQHCFLGRNFIGLGADGATIISNRFEGVKITSGKTNYIGSINGGGNFISGNSLDGIKIEGPGSDGNVIAGNIIGLNIHSNEAPNRRFGVWIVDAPKTRIGRTNGGNVISGNTIDGVRIEGSSSGAVFIANVIGANPNGTAPRPNGIDGIRVMSPGVVIGGTNFNERNIISGNIYNGIHLSAGGDYAQIRLNFIGTDQFGAYSISNETYGIRIAGAHHVQVGAAGVGSLVSGNRISGISVENGSSNTVITRCFIGCNLSGTTNLPNYSGIRVEADHVTIGGTNVGDRNLISGNATYGIELSAGRNVRIMGNHLGLGVDGVASVPNYTGIGLRNQARGVIVGGPGTGARNVVSRNIGDEIWIQGPSGGHTIQNNFIGFRADAIPFGSYNVGTGIKVENSASNLITGNAIGNCYDGIIIAETGSFANAVIGNKIGTDESGLEPVQNLFWGVRIQNASNNRIGGQSATERNVIAHNGGGILVTNTAGFSAINNHLAANLVYSNKPGLNIDIGGDGFTANDALDADTGANGLQNRPAITNCFIAGNLVYAQGNLHSAPMKTFDVDIYRADGTNAGSRSYLGRVSVHTDAGGNGAFAAGFLFNLPLGAHLTATATDPEWNTSEFSVSPAGLYNASGDADGDGIPNFWEVLYGLNPAVSNALGSDFDNDGYTDHEEYIADTAANDSDSYPAIVDIDNNGNRLITFPSSGARVYSLFANNDLMSSALWTQVGGSITGAYGYSTMSDTNLTDRRGYQIRIRLP